MDLSQIAIAAVIMQTVGPDGVDSVEEGMVRHVILDSIRSNYMQFKNEYGDLVIAVDGKNIWRKKYFQYYKARRASDRKKSDFDWDSFFVHLNTIKEELKEYFPYNVIDIVGAEADDVIGTLCKYYGNEELIVKNELILILSGDGDFQQLQKYLNVRQYSPTLNKYIVCNNPREYLKRHIIKGDRSDGIPNFLSPDNCIVIGERMKSIFETKLNVWVNQKPEEFCESNTTQLYNYKRNQKLIDLDLIPEEIYNDILDEYHFNKDNPKIEGYDGFNKLKQKNKFMQYFIDHKLTVLSQKMTDFI